MKKLNLVILVLTILSFKAFGQEFDSVITTSDQSLEWLRKLEEKKELDVQLTMLQHRILLDTNLFVRSFGDRVIMSADTSKITADCRLILVVDGKIYYFENNTESKKIETFTNYLTTENIKSLEVLDAGNVTAIYGSRGICGLISMQSSSRRKSKRLEKIFK